jgi:hypothetical protein
LALRSSAILAADDTIAAALCRRARSADAPTERRDYSIGQLAQELREILFFPAARAAIAGELAFPFVKLLGVDTAPSV